MSHNYNQILDGINDQIEDLKTTKAQYELQMAAIQAALDDIPGQIADLEALKANTHSLASNAVDLNINLNVNGTSIRSHSTSVGS